MPRPIWTTPSQFISTIREGEYFRFEFNATNAVRYQLIAGSLPPGMQLITRANAFGNSSIEGTSTITSLNPEEKIYNYSFSIRAISSDNQISDRGFSLAVNANKEPIIVGPVENLGTYIEGTRVDVKIIAVDFTPADILTFSIRSGSLPTGIELQPSGRLLGYVRRLSLSDPSTRTYNFTVEVSDGINKNLKNYSITVQKNADVDLRPVLLTEPEEMTVAEHDNYFSFKFTGLDFDGESLTYFIVNTLNDFDNKQETGYDTAGFDDYVFDQITSEIPTGLVLDPTTGWLHGRLPSLTTPQTFKFFVGVKKTNPPNTTSEFKEFSLYVYPGVYQTLTWISPSNLGDLFNGMVSDLAVKATLANESLNTENIYKTVTTTSYVLANKTVGATHTVVVSTGLAYINNQDIRVYYSPTRYFIGKVVSYNSTTGSLTFSTISTGPDAHVTPVIWTLDLPPVYYRLLPYNVGDPKPIRLPQGIRLTESGLLIGRASFRCFTLDGGSTRVSDNDNTSYDETYIFNVEARNHPNPLSATIVRSKEFTVRVRNRNPLPYENIYIRALPDPSNRLLYQNLVNATDWLNESIVYRTEDPYFGRAQELKMLFIPGVEAPLLSTYFSSETLNHYRKQMRLDKIDYSVATDQNFNPIYEVIYATIKDDRTNEQDQSTAMEINLIGKIANYYKIDGVPQTSIYPNSFVNMRARILEKLELENKGVLPRWMTSVQPDGSVPGPINVIPLAYVIPGTASTAVQRLNEKIKNTNSLKNLSVFNFAIDRYQIDRHLSKHWDFENNRFFDSQETIFDRFINEEIGLTLVDTVDYALSVPFDTINGAEVKNLLGYSDIQILSPQVFSVTHPTWSVWMNQNAVWVNNRTNALPNTSQTIERDFYVSAGGVYNLYVMNTDSVTVYIDDILIKTVNGFNVIVDPENSYTPTYIGVGNHTIKIVVSTDGGSVVWSANPTGVAVSLILDGVTVAFNTVKNYEPRVKFNVISKQPGLDGISDFKDGDLVVFAKQDLYLNYTGENNGWNIFTDPYGVLFDPAPTDGSFNNYVVIPGLYENRTDVLFKKGVASVTVNVPGTGYSAGTTTVTFSPPDIPGGETATGTATIVGGAVTGIVVGNSGSGYINAPTVTVTDSDVGGETPGTYTAVLGLNSNVRVNQRAGIWKISINDNRLFLTFEQEVKSGQLVRVKRGQTYGGATLMLANDPYPIGSTELNYIRINTRLSNGVTVFDGGSTQFVDYRDLYVDPGRGDKYVIYPKLGVFE